MATSRIVLIQLFVLIGICASHHRFGQALPTINTVSPMKPQEIARKQESAPIVEQEKGGLQLETNPHTTSVPPANQSTIGTNESTKTATTAPTSTTGNNLHINTTEKLKRGLANFMNHLNPAPYFVPQDASKGASAGSQATIINDGGADAVIKGPNRMTRPLGSPLRWGR